MNEPKPEQTDNGWQEGDPEDQPENPEPWSGGFMARPVPE